jgi:L-2-hydroxyglutarate oxidase
MRSAPRKNGTRWNEPDPATTRSCMPASPASERRSCWHGAHRATPNPGTAAHAHDRERHRPGRQDARLIPAIRQRDLLPRVAGIRALSILDDGSLVDDFLIEKHQNAIQVINAPSPVATACLTIAKQVSAMVA